MTETRQETAAEYLRAAAGTLRHGRKQERPRTRGSSQTREDLIGLAVADWLDHQAETTAQKDPTDSGTAIIFHAHALAVAAAVLGRSWPS